MRFCLPLLLSTAVLTASCSTEPSPVRLDFVGASGLTSSNRTASAADTLTSRVFATGEQPLTRLQITVSYEPTAYPIIYPTPISSFDPSDTPDGPQLLYLDSVLTSGQKELLFQNRVSVRTTSGSERWQYTATDAEGRSDSRAYRVTVRKGDSLAVYHTYTIVARPAETGAAGRRFLALRPGLLLPKFAVNKEPANQQLIDLVFTMRQGNITLETPNHPNLGLSATRWPQANRRPTVIKRTGLDFNAFQAADTFDELRTAFNDGQAYTPAGSTGALAKDNVLAFQSTDPSSGESHYGLLRVSELALTPVPVVSCTVRIQK